MSIKIITPYLALVPAGMLVVLGIWLCISSMPGHNISYPPAGVLVVIGIGLLLVITMAGFGIRSLLQIRDEMAKRKAGYKVVELNGDHHGDHLSSADAKDMESGHYDSDPTAKRS